MKILLVLIFSLVTLYNTDATIYNEIEADWYGAMEKSIELWWVVYKCQDAVKETAGFSNITEIGEIIREKVNAIRNLALDPISHIQGLILEEVLSPKTLDEQVVLIENGIHSMEQEIAYYVARLPDTIQTSIFAIYQVTFTDISRVKLELNQLLISQ